MAGPADVIAEEILRDFDQNTGAVASHAVRVDRAAVPQRLERLDTGFDDLTARLAVYCGDQPDAASVAAGCVNDRVVFQPLGVLLEAVDKGLSCAGRFRIGSITFGHSCYSAATAVSADAFTLM